MRSRPEAIRLRRPALAWIALLAALLPVAAAAQMTPAGSGATIAVSRQAQLEEALERARWHLGPWRVAPWIGIRDVTYVRGELGSTAGESDLTATAGAGFRAYLPFSDEAMVAVHALPEYNWWQENSDRNTLIGRYGAGFFGFFNRLQTELSARRVEDLGFLSPDRLVLQPMRTDTGVASAQLRVAGSIALFGAATLDQIRVLENDADLAEGAAGLLDRDRQETRVGFRYLLRGDRGHVGAGALTEQTDFVDADTARSNEGTSWYGEAVLRGNKMDLGLSYDRRDLEAQEGGTFPGFEGSTGQVVVALRPGHRLRVQLFGRRSLGYSAAEVERYREEQRLGASVGMEIGEGNLIAFYEQGEDSYFGESSETEDVTGYGVTLGYPIGRFLSLSVGTRTTRFEPAIGPDREIRELQGGFSLSLGAGPGDW